MSIQEIITELRCEDERRRLIVAAAAADALEILEERLSIMGEALTREEWEAQEQEARQRIAARG